MQRHLQEYANNYYQANPAHGSLPVGPTFCSAAPNVFTNNQPEATTDHLGLRPCGAAQVLTVTKTLGVVTGVQIDRTGGRGTLELGYAQGMLIEAMAYYFSQLKKELTAGNQFKLHALTGAIPACGTAATQYQTTLALYLKTVKQVNATRPDLDINHTLTAIDASSVTNSAKSAEGYSPVFLNLASTRANLELLFAALADCEVMTRAQDATEKSAGSAAAFQGLITDMVNRVNDCCGTDDLTTCYAQSISLIARAQSESCFPPDTPDAMLAHSCADPSAHAHACPAGYGAAAEGF